MFQRKKRELAEKTSFLNCQTEPDETGSKAMAYLKETLKQCALEQIPKQRRYANQHSQEKQLENKLIFRPVQRASNGLKYGRISSKAPLSLNQSMSKNSEGNLCGISFYTKQQIRQASMIDVPLINITQQDYLEEAIKNVNYSSLVFGQYFRSTNRYQEKELRSVQSHPKQLSPVLSRINNSGLAIKTLKRKLKNSRKDQMKQFRLNTII